MHIDIKQLNYGSFCSLFSSESNPISLYRLAIETSPVAPVTFRAASFCILTSYCFSYNVQLSHITSPVYNQRSNIITLRDVRHNRL